MKNINFLKWVLGAGIVIVLNLFFTYAINSFYPEPMWDAYCPQKQVSILPKNQTECVAQGGAWNEAYPPAPDYKRKAGDPTGYCDVNYSCDREFYGVSSVYNRNVFVVRVILGMVSLLVGFAAAAYDAVSLGLSMGGIVSLIIGTAMYWSNMNDYLRAVVLGVALVILIWLGVKKLQGQG